MYKSHHWSSVVCLTLGLLLVLATGLLASADKQDAKAVALSPETVARRLARITEVILDNHVQPPTRQEMILAAVRALLEAAGRTPPADLSRRVSDLTTDEQVIAFVREVWPKAGDGAPIAAEKLETPMLHGLLQRVPGMPNLMPVAENKVSEQILNNRYVGIGIQLAFDRSKELAQIVTPFVRGPARKAGMKAGDLIVEVDGQSMKGLSLQQVVERLRGQEGTAVTVMVRQPDTTETRTLTMTRAVVPFDTVVGYRRLSDEAWQYRVHPNEPIGYIWVKSINASTLHHLRQAEQQMQADGIRALVIDLRFNGGGGLLQHVHLLADGLLDGGVLWRLRDRNGQVTETRAEPECLLRGWPLVVLVNEPLHDKGSRLLAAALKDNGRAILVGERPGGDGYIKSIVNLPEGAFALALPTAHMERASAQSGPAEGQVRPQEWSLDPDHEVPMTKAQREKLRQWLFQKDLPEPPHDGAPEDPQLAKAIEILRGALKSGGQPAKVVP
jgi:carboxyl-terminal processing protease